MARNEARKPLLSGVVDGVLSTGIGSLVFTIFGLLAFMLTSRWLSREELGAFVVLQLVVGFVVGISGVGTDLSVTKYIAENEHEASKQKILNTVVTFRLISIAITSLLAILLQRPLFNLFGGSVYGAIIGYIPILVLLESFYRLIDSVLGGYFRFNWIALLSGLSSILSFIFTIIIIRWMYLGLDGRIWARIISMALPVILAIVFTRIQWKLELDFRLLSEVIRFSFPLFLNYILSFVFMRADTFIIGGFLGAEEIAVYEIARKIPESIESMYDAFRKVYFPFISDLFAKKRNDLAAGMLNHSLRLITFAGVFGILIAFFFGREIIIFLFSGKYQDSSLLFGLLMIVLTLNVIDYTLGYSLVAVGESNKPPLINLLHTATNFVGYFLLIPVVGIFGVAYAGIAGIIVVNPLNVHFLWRKNVLAEYSAYLKPMLVGAACYGFAEFLLPHHWFFRTSVVFLYVVLCFVFQVLTVADLQLLAGQIQRIIRKKSLAVEEEHNPA
jgi:O-antigen/teichoic acid export membrane protein